MKKLLLAGLSLLLVTGAGVSYAASPLEGRWVVAEAAGAGGMYTEESMQQAEELIGEVIEVEGTEVTLAAETSCRMTDAEVTTVSNVEFGSAGGSWSNVGLEPITPGGYEYDVTKIELTCTTTAPTEQKTRTIIMGNNRDLVLLNVWETWVRLARPE